MSCRPFTRREFLRTSVCAAAGLCLGGCASAPASSTPANYYVTNKARLVKEFGPIARQLHQLTVQAHGEALADAVNAETLAEFERLLPQLPDIGGDRNTLTETLVHSMGALTFYRAMTARGQPVQEVG